MHSIALKKKKKRFNFLGDPNTKPNSIWYVLTCELSNFYSTFVLDVNYFKYNLYKYGSHFKLHHHGCYFVQYTIYDGFYTN